MDDSTADVLRRTDELIRRRRPFVAGSQPAPPAASAEDDLPVLTEVVTEQEAARATAPPHMQKLLDGLREELSLWLEQELPHTVLKVTDGLADQLMAELTHQAEKNLLPRLIARLDSAATQAGPDNEG